MPLNNTSKVFVCVTGVTAERWYESTLMLEGLERMTEELLACADRQKKGVYKAASLVRSICNDLCFWIRILQPV